jgi:hypothetical protein
MGTDPITISMLGVLRDIVDGWPMVYDQERTGYFVNGSRINRRSTAEGIIRRGFVRMAGKVKGGVVYEPTKKGVEIVNDTDKRLGLED